MKMWCPDCKTDFETVPGSEVQVCPGCQSAAKKGKRRRRVPKLEPKPKKRRRLATTSSTAPTASSSTTSPGHQPANSVPRSKRKRETKRVRAESKGSSKSPATLSTEPKFRVDSPHEEHGIRATQRDNEWLKRAGSWLQKKSMIHVAMFGLLVFLAGQAVLVWAFLVGHYAAWSVANLISVAGVALAVVAISATLRNLYERMERLSQLVGRQEPVRKSHKPERKLQRKK